MKRWRCIHIPTGFMQISQAFYSIMYYDTYQRTIEHILILLAMAAVLFAASALFIRRQRYASL